MAYKDKRDAYKRNNELNKKNYDRINLTVQKGRRELIQKAASMSGESTNAFINRLIDAELSRMESGEWIEKLFESAKEE